MSATFANAFAASIGTAPNIPSINVSLEKDPTSCEQRIDTIRRAAFDFGGGSIRVLVADVDLKTKKIEKLYNADIPIKFRLNLSQNGETNGFSDEILAIAQHAFAKLLQTIAKYNPQQFAGTATESFRIAHNGEHLLKKLSLDTGVPIQVIPQKEEGHLGFLSAVNYTSSDPANTIVLDIGTGSVQITGQNDDGSVNTYGLKLGTVVLNERIAKEIRGQKSTPDDINPIMNEEAISLIEYVGKELNSVPDELAEKLRSKDVRLIATFAVSTASVVRSDTGLDYLKNDILERNSGGSINRSTAAKGIFCYAFVKKFGIEKCHLANSNKEGNTSGMLLEEKFWP